MNFPAPVRLLLTLPALTACATEPLPPPRPTPPALATTAEARLAVQEGSRTSAIVVLRADNGDARTVAEAQRAVLAIAGPQARLLRRYTLLPALALAADRQVWARLDGHPLVHAIEPDRALEIPQEPVVALGGPGGNGASAAVAASAGAAWALGLRGKGATIAIVDTGVQAQHPDLQGQIVAQRCFAASGCPPFGAAQGDSAQDVNGHGTHVAAIAASRGKIGPPGIAPDARLVAVRVLGNDGKGKTSDLLAALDWLAGQAKTWPLHAVNLSLGGTALHSGPCDKSEAALALAVQLLGKKGVVTIAAAGNGGSNGALSSPGCLSQVISVGATYAQAVPKAIYPKVCSDSAAAAGQLACFSNRNKHLSLVAPGAPIRAASQPGSAVATLSGTSQATPVVSGVVALLAPCWPSPSAASLVQWLRATGIDTLDKTSGLSLRRVHAGQAAWACLPWG